MNTTEIIAKINTWMARHWQKVLIALCGVVLMQQCTISSLQRQIIQMKDANTESLAAAEPDTVASRPDTTIATTPKVDHLVFSEQNNESTKGRSNWILVGVLAAIAAAGAGIWYMRKNAIFPIGMLVWGRLKMNDSTGDLTYHLVVRNMSSKAFEVSDAVTNFIIRGGTRRFRASLSDLPMTLQPGTKYETTISLTGLVSRNIELQQAKAINMSVVCDNKKHSTLPSPIRFANGN